MDFSSSRIGTENFRMLSTIYDQIINYTYFYMRKTILSKYTDLPLPLFI